MLPPLEVARVVEPHLPMPERTSNLRTLSGTTKHNNAWPTVRSPSPPSSTLRTPSRLAGIWRKIGWHRTALWQMQYQGRWTWLIAHDSCRQHVREESDAPMSLDGVGSSLCHGAECAPIVCTYVCSRCRLCFDTKPSLSFGTKPQEKGGCTPS